MEQEKSNNLEIWDSVCTTDPAFTKNYTGMGGFKGTAVAAQYVVKQATEKFGPIGIGWGYTVLEERFDIGGPLKVKEGENPVSAVVNTIKLRLWYMLNGTRGEMEQYGHTPFVYSNSSGIHTDYEASKKSVTDAMKKCLTLLGFTADIYMGLFDDEHYRNEVSDAIALEKADNKIDKHAEQVLEYQEWFNNNLRLITTATNLNELSALYKSAIRKLELRKDEAGKITITKAKDKRKTELDASTGAAE